MEFFSKASDLRAHLNSIGVTGPAQDAIVKETGTARHVARVSATWEAAKAAASCFIATRSDETYTNACAAFLIALDLMGVGGRDGVEGFGTTRAPFAQQLGKGRWQANDGPAYRSAAWESLHRFTNGSMLLVTVDEDGDVMVSHDPDVFIDIFSETDRWAPYSNWLETLAREGLRVSLGMDRWCEYRASGVETWYACRFAGEPRNWALFLNRVLEARTNRPDCESQVRDTQVEGTPVPDPDLSVPSSVRGMVSLQEAADGDWGADKPKPIPIVLTPGALFQVGACLQGVISAWRRHFGDDAWVRFDVARERLEKAGELTDENLEWLEKAARITSEWLTSSPPKGEITWQNLAMTARSAREAFKDWDLTSYGAMKVPYDPACWTPERRERLERALAFTR